MSYVTEFDTSNGAATTGDILSIIVHTSTAFEYENLHQLYCQPNIDAWSMSWTCKWMFGNPYRIHGREGRTLDDRIGGGEWASAISDFAVERQPGLSRRLPARDPRPRLARREISVQD
jgi:hypothetical protein